MKQVLSQAGEMRPSHEWGCLTALMERKFPKFEEWYANANDIVGRGKSSWTYVHAPRPPPHFYSFSSTVTKHPLFYGFLSIETNKSLLLSFHRHYHHMYTDLKSTKQKREPFYFESFQKLKKRNLEPILSVLIHSLIKFKCKRNSIEPGLPGL